MLTSLKENIADDKVMKSKAYKAYHYDIKYNNAVCLSIAGYMCLNFEGLFYVELNELDRGRFHLSTPFLVCFSVHFNLSRFASSSICN